VDELLSTRSCAISRIDQSFWEARYYYAYPRDSDMHACARTIYFSLLLGFGLHLTGWTKSVAAGSDESGTLVMVGRTADVVIVSVDSKINHTPEKGKPDIPTKLIAGERKLVDVGQKSACAINGFLGGNPTDLDVATALRAWVRVHPKVEAHIALKDLLSVAGDAWNKAGYTIKHRPDLQSHQGDQITQLICGDIVDGRPVIVRGATFVNNQFKATIRSPLPPEGGDILYVAGEIPSTDDLARRMMNCPKSYNNLAPHYREFLNQVGADMRNDPKTVEAFQVWQSADGQTTNCLIKNPVTQIQMSSSWKQSSVKTLFASVYRAVEKNTSDVAKPNNVRIITSCKRFNTTVEGEWPSCPPVKTVNRTHPLK
jgi:hypothetical protein